MNYSEEKMTAIEQLVDGFSGYLRVLVAEQVDAALAERGIAPAPGDTAAAPVAEGPPGGERPAGAGPVEWKVTTPPGELRFFPSRDVDMDNPDTDALRALFAAMQAQFTRPEAGWNRAQFMRVLELSRGAPSSSRCFPSKRWKQSTRSAVGSHPSPKKRGSDDTGQPRSGARHPRAPARGVRHPGRRRAHRVLHRPLRERVLLDRYAVLGADQPRRGAKVHARK